LFLVVGGSGWVSGPDGEPRPLGVGRGVYIARGEMHAKGSDTGMTAIMVQLADLAAAPVALARDTVAAGRSSRS
jgi:hypothetical protein